MSDEKQAIKFILENADKFDWTLHGLGMLRLDLGDGYRLNVWSENAVEEGVSGIHTHPWSMYSKVIAGVMRNHRYHITTGAGGTVYWEQVVGCGNESGLKGQPMSRRLYDAGTDTIHEGESYIMTPAQIHQAEPEDGTVTLMQKRGSELQDARVFWPKTDKWGDARPCIPSQNQVQLITQNALEKQFNE